MSGIKPLASWTLDHVYALYESVPQPATETLKLHELFTSACNSESPLLKAMPQEELCHFCAYIIHKVEASKLVLISFMSDYKSVQTEPLTQSHKVVMKTLGNYFFPRAEEFVSEKKSEVKEVGNSEGTEEKKTKEKKVVEKVSVDVQTNSNFLTEELVQNCQTIDRKQHIEREVEKKAEEVKIPRIPVRKYHNAVMRLPNFDIRSLVKSQIKLTGRFDKLDLSGCDDGEFADLYMDIVEDEISGEINGMVIKQNCC
eukprot:TRINITY_DN8171_c0_g4_i2.p1 TRINITY_DN8171_c0_g4~~TRINITY_DN8171_c0_g4_i2.p1  ORF type:complete len:256 (+),score=55.04 TRINITY_DN8171_c0_g4_i2:44-811(+)